MDLEIAPEHAAFRAAVRELAQGTVLPLAAEVDRDHRFPEEAVTAAAEAGLMGVLIPREYGGAGLDALAFAICIEELAQACASTSVIVDVHTSVGSEPILLFGTEEQKRKWLPRLASGELLGAFALTEPASGSDAASLKASARRTGEGYVLNGTKIFITNVGRAGLYIVFARSGPEEKAAGVSAFLVPAGAPGVRVGQVFRKMGLNGSPTGELVLEDVVVPAENRLGAEGQGFTVAMRALDSGRIGISGQALGIAQAAVDESRAVLAQRAREQVRQQGDDFLLAEMATRLESARLLAYHAAWLCSLGRPFTRQASMAKLHCTDTAMQLALDAVQLAGEDGTFSGSPFERHVRDAKALQIYEGSNQVQRMVIAREVLR
ncbi:MAG TPA: acyl-CoA dehydrogenase family protein [Candidatus Dormibacteraeota bacterium]|nr:acyl-CoA dehydrogenase family protein [Candidatus Dormibacteraeota bacterium]